MKAIVVKDQAAGTAGMTLVERPKPQAAINDVVVQIHASGLASADLSSCRARQRKANQEFWPP
jgi:NADPH:quinone reductase-like Zn-dependent oxidoreductase